MAWAVVAFAHSHYADSRPLQERTSFVRVDEGHSGQSHIVIVSSSDGSRRQIGSVDNYNEAAWSPDGATIVALAPPDRLHIIRARDGMEKVDQLPQLGEFMGWSQNSSNFAIRDWQSGQMATYTRGGMERCRGASPDTGGAEFVRNIGWSPDSQAYALSVNDSLMVCAAGEFFFFTKSDLGFGSEEHSFAEWQVDNRLALFVYRGDEWIRSVIDFEAESPVVEISHTETLLYVDPAYWMSFNVSTEELGIDSSRYAVPKAVPSADGWTAVLTIIEKDEDNQPILGTERVALYEPASGQMLVVPELPGLKRPLGSGVRDYSVYVSPN
jgi:hypothetical protein